MSKERIGDACAFIPGVDGSQSKYIKIGVAFRDTTYNTVSVMIDTIPLDKGWTGWVNIFQDEGRKPRSHSAPTHQSDDDIPF